LANDLEADDDDANGAKKLWCPTDGHSDQIRHLFLYIQNGLFYVVKNVFLTD
jgi:hypothetical protein